MVTVLKLFYCDHHPIPLPEGHKFPLAKYRMLREVLAQDGNFAFEPAPLAKPETIALAHDPEYVRRFLEGSLPPQIIRRIGFPWSEGLVQRTLCSVGATLSATEQALSTGFGGTLAGGTHHAFYSEGAGFCVFNDLAVSIRHHQFCRAAVIDLDVHQGDGTAALFQGDPQVFTLSLHGEHNFPFRKQRSRLDVAFPDGTEDNEYLNKLEETLPQVWAFQPEVVFYQSGVDALESDKLGRLALTPQGLAMRDRMVFEQCRKKGIPVVTTIGGGYSDPIEATVTAHAQTFRIAAVVFS